MRRITAEERALFLAALTGCLPPKAVVPKPAATVRKTVENPPPSPRAERLILPGQRRISEEDLALFLEAIGRHPRAKPLPEPVVLPSLPVKVPRLRRAGGGLDGSTKRKLEKGEITPSAKLDLHGMTESAAHGALLTFLHTAHSRGDRLVLVVTGKGEMGRGVLRQMVPRWLEEAPMAVVIAEKRWAHKRHGGEGALYVYLKKR